MLEEDVHGRHLYLARTVDSAPPVRGLYWLKNTNNSFCAVFIELLLNTGERGFLKNTGVTLFGGGSHNNVVIKPSL